MTSYSIFGYVKSQIEGEGLANLTVKLFNGSGGELGIPPTVTNSIGFFQFLVSSDIINGMEDPLVRFKVSQSETVLLTPETSFVWTPDFHDGVTLIVDPAEVIPNKSYEILGNIRFSNGVPASGVVLKFYFEEFRNRQSFYGVLTDGNGHFDISISSGLFGGIAEDKVGISIDVYNAAETVLLASSVTYKLQSQLSIDIVIGETDSAVAIFQNLITTISDNVNVDIVELEESDFEFLARATNAKLEDIKIVVKAHQYANEIATSSPDLMYAIAQEKGADSNPIMYMKRAEMRLIINNAIDKKSIAEVTSDNIDTFIEAAKAYQVVANKSLEVKGESYALSDVLLSFLGSSENVHSFLEEYVGGEHDSTSAFWQAYKDANGETAANEAKKGVRLAAITGFQPEMISALMSETTGEDGLHSLAGWSETEWINKIDTVCTAANKLCVPSSIRQDSTDINNTEAKTTFAKSLKTIIQDMYPLANISSQLSGTDGSAIISDSTIRSQVITFIGNNPDFDLRVNSVHEINSTDHNLTGVTDINGLKNGLTPFQTLMRLTGGKPEGIVSMVTAGLDSAYAITNVGLESFIDEHADALGGEDMANVTYSRAELMNAASTEVLLSYLDNTQFTANSSVQTMPAIYSPVNLGPDLSELFGNLNYCSCRSCLSLYSPSAYLADLLNFIKAKATTSSNALFDELIRRRKDLKYIDLSCKNTDTAIPYIDLVIELLEKLVLDQIKAGTPALDVPDSFQTKGDTPDLSVYPEHIEKEYDTVNNQWIYKDYTEYYRVYDDILSKAKYPRELPFNLALEEVRAYLLNLGNSRFELMQSFKPLGTPETNGIDDISIYAEQLGISKDVVEIITTISETDAWKYYSSSESTFSAPDPSNIGFNVGGTWYVTLSDRIDVLIQQIKISYKDLLQLLETDFLNKLVGGVRPISVSSICDLKNSQLLFSSPSLQLTFFKNLYRYVRLWKASGLSIYGLDTLLRMLKINELTNDTFILLGRIIYLSKQLNINAADLCMWFNDIDTTAYINYDNETFDRFPSQYDTVFRNKSVINAPINSFDDFSALPANYSGQIQLIAAFSKTTENNVKQILSFIGINDLAATPVTLTALSRVYITSKISASINTDIPQMLDLFYMLRFKKFGSPIVNTFADNHDVTSDDTSLKFLEDLNDLSITLRKLPLSFDEINYLLRNKNDNNVYGPSSDSIKSFFIELRNELQKFPAGSDSEYSVELILKLKNVVYQHFIKQFNVASSVITSLLDGLQVKGISPATDVDLLTALIDEKFINSQIELSESDLIVAENSIPRSADLPLYNMSTLYMNYRLMYKVIYIAQKLGLREQELNSLFSDPTIINFDFTRLIVTTADETQESVQSLIQSLFNGLIQLNDWLILRNNLSLSENDFLDLLSAGSNGHKQDWLDIIERNTEWGELFTDLVGTAITNGILGINFNDDCDPANDQSVAILATVKNIIGWCKVVSAAPSTIYPTLKSDVTLDIAHSLLLIVRAQYDEQTWFSIGKTIHDSVREKQRQALVSYILAHSDVPYDTNNRKIWFSENDLFGYLLIDVEMKPGMMTSRIKQAISSVQLFIDRVVLGIEYKNNDITQKLSLSPALTQQWEKWRKWYSIWEANRQVFLYPENWIEPELRDNKSIFFTDLETELLQDEFTDERAADAFNNYLIKLDAVARLEPVSGCYDAATGIYHAFGRSYGTPNYYYYRRLVDNEWTHWEPIDLEINSEHVMPIVWSSRLYLFWATFKDKAGKHPAVNNSDYWDGTWSNSPWFISTQDQTGSKDPDLDQKQIAVTLNWSEYKAGKWLKQKISKDPMLIKLNPSVNPFLSDRQKNNENFYNNISRFRTLDAEDIVKSRFYLFPQIDKPNTDNILWIFLMHPNSTSNKVVVNNEDETLEVISAFKFIDNNREPEIFRNGMDSWTCPAPNQTYIQNMKFVEDSLSGDKPLNADAITELNRELYKYYNESIDLSKIRQRTNSYKVLGKTDVNGTYKIRSKSNFENNPLEDHFYFEDDRNIYFVRVTIGPRVVQGPPPFTPNFPPITGSAGGGTTGGVTSGGVVLGGSATSIALGGIQVQKSSAFSTGLFLVDDANLDLAISNNVAGILYNSIIPQQQGVTNSAPVQSMVGSILNQTVPYYYFQTFYHPHIHNFIKVLNDSGIDGLLKLEMQVDVDTMDFSGVYQPGAYVRNELSPSQYYYPDNKVDFTDWGSYSGYNWELFFHVPMLIAQRLSDNQQFEEARKWFHYIFDPTSNVDDQGQPISTTANNAKQRFWRFRPFYEQAGKSISTLEDILAQINANNNSNQALIQLNKWQNDPFNPYAIARLRTLAFMKNVVMKYLDNLIAWGDQLFRRDTIESINEATQLYILAANILGKRPEEIPSLTQFTPKNFMELDAVGLDAFSEAKVKIESYLSPGVVSTTNSTGSGSNLTWYFCMSTNSKLLQYWNTVSDRLFKIRNNMNLDGQTQQLALFDPPIDPALLVQAAAAGVSIDSVLDDINSDPSHYRFSYVLQKANELCSDVKALGSALLSAIEKKDAEALAVLRSVQEISVLEKVKLVKQAQIEEADANIAAIQKSIELIQTKLDYYSTRTYTNAKEQEQMALLQKAIPLQTKQSDKQAISSTLAIIPSFNIQAPFALGPSFGGSNLSSAMNAISAKIGAEIAINSTRGSMAQIIAGYDRRFDDWQFQKNSAAKELEQLNKQIIAAQIRKDITERELDAHELQIENSKAVDEYLRGKYSNAELYNWMVGQISTTYFQSYQLAYDMAKKAERCFEYELPLANMATGGYIKFGYWDSLRKGLLTGEKLQYDLRKLEIAYMDANERELEMTKHISLVSLDPRQLINLKTQGSCSFFLPEEIFDMDYPGHYLRRIKSVAITIPCVAGPYTTINAQLTLTDNAIRKGTAGTLEVDSSAVKPMIATSSAQNDSGIFELNFKDERYLPFEGKGSVSQWNLIISAADQIKLFELESISDVVIHMKYTARYGGDGFRDSRITNLNTLLSSFTSGLDNTNLQISLPRYVSLKHEYSGEWFRYNETHLINTLWDYDTFPVFAKNKIITIAKLHAAGIFKNGQSGTFRIKDNDASGTGIIVNIDNLQSGGITFVINNINNSKQISLKVQKNNAGVWEDVDINDVFEDIFLTAFYTLS